MAYIKSVGEVLLERIDECVDAASKHFSDAIRPIYLSNHQGIPEHIGSCVLLMVNKAPHLLTAAHVIDYAKEYNLYVAGESSLVKIEGDFLATAKPGGIRADDHFDFAVRRISSQTVSALGNVKYIPEYEQASSMGDPTGHIYLALGYPNSKNRKIKVAEKYVRPQLWKYSSTQKPNQALALKLGIHVDSHYFLGFNKKHSKDVCGNLVDSISPRGISGGALIDLGNLAHPANLNGSTPQGLLTGLLIENHANYSTIVATSLEIILQGLSDKTKSHL